MQRRLRQKLQERVLLERHHKDFILNWNAWVHWDPIYSEAQLERVCERFTQEHAKVGIPGSDIQDQILNMTRHFHFLRHCGSRAHRSDTLIETGDLPEGYVCPNSSVKRRLRGLV